MRLRHGAFYYVDSRGGAKPWVHIGKTYAEAILRYGQLEAAQTDRRDFAALAAKFVKESLPERAETTQRVYRTLMKKPLEVFGHVMPDDIEQQHAYRYIDERGKAVGKQEIVLVSTILSFGVAKGWCRANRLIGMKFGEQVRRKRYLTDAELASALEKASPAVAHAIRFMHYTALRVSDAMRVRWKDWQADGLHIHVSKTGADLVLERTPGLEALMAELKRRRVGSLYVIAETNGKPWTYRRLYAAWSKVAPADANLHDLRRKRLTDLAKEKGLDFAQALAAHSNPRMTQTYVVGARRIAV